MFSIDTTDDNLELSESEYFDKVKSIMSDSNENKVEEEKKDNQNISNKKDRSKNKPALSINIFSYVQIIIVLVLVILVIYGLSLILKKFLGLKGNVHGNADIILNQALGQGKWLQIVHICGKYLVLGITNDNVNLLTEIKDQKEIEKFEIILNEKKVNTSNNFVDMITDFFKNKLKKGTDKERFDYEVDSIEFLNKQKERLDELKK